jgi:hypothetical protein
MQEMKTAFASRYRESMASQGVIIPYPWQNAGAGFADLARQYGKMTVAQAAKLLVTEVNTGTNNLAFPVLVSARAALQLATLIDARQFCRTEMIPEGGGLTYHFQYITQPAGWLPVALGGTGISAYTGAGSTDISATDPTFADKSATVATYPARTFVEDKAQRQLAYNLAQILGISHGNVLNALINSVIYAQVKAATTNIVTEGSSGDAKSTNYTFTDMFNMRGLVEQSRFKPDSWLTYPQLAAAGSGGAATGFYPFMMSNIASVQFTSAFIDYMRTGGLTEMFGLKLFLDAVFAPTNNATPSGSVMGALLQSGEAVGWAQTEDVTSEIQRWAPQVGFNLVTHVIGASALIVDPAVALVEHA